MFVQELTKDQMTVADGIVELVSDFYHASWLASWPAEMFAIMERRMRGDDLGGCFDEDAVEMLDKFIDRTKHIDGWWLGSVIDIWVANTDRVIDPDEHTGEVTVDKNDEYPVWVSRAEARTRARGY